MSDILARIRVSEREGMRRFLYPLSATLAQKIVGGLLPESLELRDGTGPAIPLQVSPSAGGLELPLRLDFALSLAPLEVQELVLTSGGARPQIDDPIHFAVSAHTGDRHSTQQRFALAIDRNGAIQDVQYDGIAHLRGRSAILRNGQVMTTTEAEERTGEDLISVWVRQEGTYDDGCPAKTCMELTACKSWVHVTHVVARPQPDDEVTFHLPMSATAPVLTADFGVGGGVYAKIPVGQTVTWDVLYDTPPIGHWTLAQGERVDQQGETTTSESYCRQRWFHLIDSDKALAVAITRLPTHCRRMVVSLSHDGNVDIRFTLRRNRLNLPMKPAEFGVCYHFLNDVPAIAAATNPQSILLPPTVEVLPV